ncbi:hypothetical protein [Paenarthrobacter sp. A20]|uniref:hypothetical protein n=1 Tax=Paenarthrobacter sp. A20 TaxID=2817891 RepID=UPI0020A1354E|nr:hypothetical protein [Paenarthrobacter sp. A20]MCP1414421.1 hypothetical protein [Paenarthrobacter sp. A20]
MAASSDGIIGHLAFDDQDLAFHPPTEVTERANMPRFTPAEIAEANAFARDIGAMACPDCLAAVYVSATGEPDHYCIDPNSDEVNEREPGIMQR